MPKTLPVDVKVKAAALLAVATLVRFEMVRRRLTYGDLANLLNEAGVDEKERNLANKVLKGELPAWLFLLCLKVMGSTSVNFADWPVIDDKATELVPKESKFPKNRRDPPK